MLDTRRKALFVSAVAGSDTLPCNLKLVELGGVLGRSCVSKCCARLTAATHEFSNRGVEVIEITFH